MMLRKDNGELRDCILILKKQLAEQVDASEVPNISSSESEGTM